jgi:tetratricopeptide (TPR) repeat protein
MLMRDVNSLWAKGNEAYSMGEFNNAIQCYSKIEKQGLVSAALYYNMGNAYYRLKENGKAILYYERTLKVDPANSDARINLQFAGAQTLDKIEEVPDFIFVTWIKNVRNSLSSNGWATLGIGSDWSHFAVFACLSNLLAADAQRKFISLPPAACFSSQLVSFLFCRQSWRSAQTAQTQPLS